MSNTRFKSNVTHNGVLFKTGDVVEGLEADIQSSLVGRGLAEETKDTATHNLNEGDTSGRSLLLNGVASIPSQTEIDAEVAKQTAAKEAAEAAAAKAAEQQVQQAQRIQDGGAEQQTMPGEKTPVSGQPTAAQIAAEAAQIQ